MKHSSKSNSDNLREKLYISKTKNQQNITSKQLSKLTVTQKETE